LINQGRQTSEQHFYSNYKYSMMISQKDHSSAVFSHKLHSS
jgi:hypothetical protein